MSEWHMCECGMERLPPGVGACSACEVADRWAARYAAMERERDAALDRAEQAERERDRLRGIVEAVRRGCLSMRRNANLDDAPEVEYALEEIEDALEEIEDALEEA